MSGETIERVARAICVANDSEPDAPNGAVGPLWKLYDADARAAIKAMREPTDEMIRSGAEGSGEDSDCVAICAWRAMIDEALK